MAATALADEIEGLNDGERIALKTSIEDIVADTPMTQVAAVRIKKLIPKIIAGGGDALKKLIIEIASETAAKILKGP